MRLLSLLQASSVASAVAACTVLSQQLQAPMAIMRQERGDAAKCTEALEAQQALFSLESTLASAVAVIGAAQHPFGAGAVGSGATPAAWQAAWQQLESMETSFHTECRYCYGPDWEVKPGKLVSRKGTWLKANTRFSWELNDSQKLYLPTGIVMPVMQIGKVTDPVELKRHEWVGQHVRVWMKPAIVRTLEARRGAWFVYYPHFEDKGLVLVAQLDTWMKRTTQLSGELEPFEMMYIPKGLAIQIASDPELVEEEWEKYRHPHVHQHRKIVLASPPLTMRQEKYDIFVGQGEDRWVPQLMAKQLPPQ